MRHTITLCHPDPCFSADRTWKALAFILFLCTAIQSSYNQIYHIIVSKQCKEISRGHDVSKLGQRKIDNLAYMLTLLWTLKIWNIINLFLFKCMTRNLNFSHSYLSFELPSVKFCYENKPEPIVWKWYLKFQHYDFSH